jgi:RNA polymerase sigma factor for flagellar operon FliA
MKTPAIPMSWSESVRSSGTVVRQRFVESHLDVVRYLALRIAARLPASVELDDLVHDGIVGLLDAVEKYDARRGVRFRTYAEARVRGAIIDGLRHKDWCPRSVRRGQREMDEIVGTLQTVHGRPATEEEIAGAMNLDLEDFRNLLRDLSSGALLSLDEMPSGAELAVAPESDLPHGRLERRELTDAIAAELRELPERERRVVELYYHEGMNMKEVGLALGVTESRVCQLHAQAASRLRVGLRKRLHVSARPAAPPQAAAAGGRRRE